MTDSATTTAPAPTPVKPGWHTSEFYGAWAVKILGALMASGIFPDSSIAFRVCGAALTLLGFLGYTYARVAIKTAAMLLLLGLVAGPQLACATVKSQASAGKVAVVDCVKADRTAIENLIGELAWDAIEAAGKLGSPDWGALVTAAEARGVVVGGCAFAEFEAAGKPATAAMPGTVVSALATPPPTPYAGAAALERLRAELGGVQWQTSSGVR